MTDQSSTVVHVVDRTDGGVPVAVATYIANSPPQFRHVVVSPFSKGKPAPCWSGTTASFIDLGTGHLARRRRIRSTVRELSPQVVHAHSSFAGAYVRSAIRHTRARIVYTPHCFSFEREDIGTAQRALFRLAEAVLARNTDLIAACSPGERDAASALASTSTRVDYIPNVTIVSPRPSSPTPAGALRVGMIGRVSAQKDPQYFLDTVNTLREHGVDITPVWIGSGPPDEVQCLADAGVDVSGWLDRERLEAAIDSLDLYVHSAAWEGFPISLLDAHASGLPALARPIRALAGLDESLSSEQGLTAMIEAAKARTFTSWSAQNHHAWSRYLVDNTHATQTRALQRVWGNA